MSGLDGIDVIVLAHFKKEPCVYSQNELEVRNDPLKRMTWISIQDLGDLDIVLGGEDVLSQILERLSSQSHRKYYKIANEGENLLKLLESSGDKK